jgi:hypothetical protein
VEACLLDLDEILFHRAARLERVAQRLAQEAAGNRLRIGHQVVGVALRDDLAAALAGAGTEVDDVVRAADRVLVVLDHHQRVAFRFELLQYVEQDLVVAVVQADGRLVEDVAHASQIASQLGSQSYPLRFSRLTAWAPSDRASGSPGRRRRGSRGASSARKRCRARFRLHGPAALPC